MTGSRSEEGSETPPTARAAPTVRPGFTALIVDPDPESARRFSVASQELGLQPLVVATGTEALGHLHTPGLAVAVLDLSLYDVPARVLLRRLTAVERRPVIVTSAAPTVRTAVELMRAGATDVVAKDAGADDFERAIRVAVSQLEDMHSRAAVEPEGVNVLGRYPELFRRSAVMRAVEQVVMRVAGLRVPILIHGESGVGKEHVARAIHHLSGATGGPFVGVACAGLPPHRIDAELFGDRDDADGKLASAAGGTAFVDEIADLPLAVQARLAAWLEKRSAAIRFVAATSIDLYALVAAGRVRDDLYEALSVATVTVPPLRERRDEIDFLARHFLEIFSACFERPVPVVSDEVAQALRRYDWPGNLRELEHMMKRWVVLGSEADLLEELEMRRATTRRSRSMPAGATGLREIGRRAAREAERRALQDALARANGNRSAAARELKVSYKTLLQKLARMGLTGRETPGSDGERANARSR